MLKIKIEDISSCTSATNNIPSKTSYGMKPLTTNEIFYFGKPPKKPETLHNYLKSKKV